MLIGRAEQIVRQRRERLRPGKSRSPRKRDHTPQRIDGVERPVRTERGLPDVRPHGIDATAAKIEREQLVFGGRYKQEFGLGIETDDALDRRQFALQHSLDRSKPGQPIELRSAAFGGQSDADAGRARQDLELTNSLRRLLLRRSSCRRSWSTAPERERCE